MQKTKTRVLPPAMVGEQYFSIKNYWNTTIDVVYFLLSNLYFYTYFHLSPLLDHHFFGLWRGETAQYLSWKIGCAKKAKRPISHVIWDFSPVVWPFSDSCPIHLYLIFEISSWKNPVWGTGFLVYFEMDFYCLCSLKKTISKLIFAN